MDGGEETAECFLEAFDYDEDDFCECDSDVRTGSAGFVLMALEYNGDAEMPDATRAAQRTFRAGR